jgi:hypothetical protein
MKTTSVLFVPSVVGFTEDAQTFKIVCLLFQAYILRVLWLFTVEFDN